MIDLMKIGVSLTLKDEATAKLSEFQKKILLAHGNFEKLNKDLELFQKHLEPTIPLLNTFSASLTKAAGAMGAFAKSFDGLNPLLKAFEKESKLAAPAVRSVGTAARSGSRSIDKLNTSLSLSGIRMNNLSRSASILKEELGTIDVVTMSGGGGKRRPPNDGNRRRWSFHNARHFRHFAIEPGVSKLGIMGGMIGTGNVALGAAFGAVLLTKASYEAQSRFQQAQ